MRASTLKRERIILIVIMVCYICAGLIALKSHSMLSLFERDGVEMLFDAKRIFNGEPYISDFWPFGHMATVALVKFITGIDFFTSAKLITLLSGAGVLILTYLIGKEVFSKEIAILAVLVLATNHFFFFHSFLVEMDMLFTFFFLLSVYFLVKGNDWRHYFWCGAFAGISYMVKYGTYAMFPVVILVAALSLTEKGMVDFLKKVVIFIVAFFIFSSPWLIHNKKTNGSAFYSKHYINVAWGMNRPQPMPPEYWSEYFRLNEEYSSFGDVVKDTEKFVRNWLGNIIGLPVNIINVLSIMGFFMPAAFLIAFKVLDRQRLILILVTLGYLSLVTMAYTWERYLLPLMSIFCIMVAFCIYEIIPQTFSTNHILKMTSFNVPFRTLIVTVLIFFSIGKSYGKVNSFIHEQDLVEYKVAGEWLSNKITEDDWLMLMEPMTAWYAGTANYVKYPADNTVPFEDAVRTREQNTYFFFQETLTTKIITDVDYLVYDEWWWSRLFPFLSTDEGPILPENFKPVFTTSGARTRIVIYKIYHD